MVNDSLNLYLILINMSGSIEKCSYETAKKVTRGTCTAKKVTRA